MASDQSSEAAHVRTIKGEDSINITFTLEGSTHVMRRSKAEELSKTLARILLTVVKTEKKRNKKHHRHEAAPTSTSREVKVQLLSAALEEVPGDTPNDEAWGDGSVLAIGSHSYPVRVNMPAVLQLKLPDVIMTGCAVVPQVRDGRNAYFSCTIHPPIHLYVHVYFSIYLLLLLLFSS